VLGTLSILHVASDHRYDPEDLDLLDDLALRAALALDNARLYSDRDEIARVLQRELRPPDPTPIPGLDLQVVFDPAGEGIEVGGAPRGDRRRRRRQPPTAGRRAPAGRVGAGRPRDAPADPGPGRDAPPLHRRLARGRPGGVASNAGGTCPNGGRRRNEPAGGS